MQSLGSNKL
jgi:hypothetical protein